MACRPGGAMVSVYFSHSYRDDDQQINEYFLNLMRDTGIMPSVDVPSNRLNSAKLERQFGFNSGLICVLPDRATGPSAYILSEIWMALRSGKPTLVFAEDTIPHNFLPDRLIKDRFSRRSYWRSTRDHLQRIESFLQFSGKAQLPRIRPSDRQRTAFVLGLSSLEGSSRDAVGEAIEARKYEFVDADQVDGDPVDIQHTYAGIRDASFVLAFVDNMKPRDAYLVGFARGAVVPTIMIRHGEQLPMFRGVPDELGPRLVARGARELAGAVHTEIDIFEDEAFQIDRGDEIGAYINFLKTASGSTGRYDPDQRQVFIQNYGDAYNIGQAGAAGRDATNRKK